MRWWMLLFFPYVAPLTNYIISISPRNMSNFIHVPAITNSTDSLSLLGQYFIDNGRHSHLELSNRAMLGCFLSHMAVWRMVQDVSVVWEEDVVLEPDFERQIHDILHNTTTPWHVIMLNGRVWHASTGRARSVNHFLNTCAERCTWSGTRGYIVNKAGADLLLRHMEPISVQVDAYISLLASYRGLQLFWVKQEIAHQQPLHLTTVWDGCLRCYLTSQVLFILCVFFVLCSLHQCTRFVRPPRCFADTCAWKPSTSKSAQQIIL